MIRLFIVLFIKYAVIVTSSSFRPEEFVNTLAGTFSGDDYSTGNTLPLAGLPWGFNHWAIQSVDDRGSQTTSWWFRGDHRSLRWLRCTHQPSPWIGDWGWFIFSPIVGELHRTPEYEYEPRGSIFKPYHIHAVVAPHNMIIELTPSSHGAILRVVFPSQSIEKHVCFAQGDWISHDMSPVPNFYGKSTKIHVDRKLVLNFNLYFYVEAMSAKSIVHGDDMICFRFDNSAESVEVHMATSLISKELAKRALDREIPSKSVTFDDAYHKAKDIWNNMLSRVEVRLPQPITEENNRHLTIFYTSLFRALMFPRRLDEIDMKGEVVHYSPYDNEGRYHSGPLCTDNGFWDTFRTVYPLISLIYPDYLGDIIQGWLNAYREGGWLPSWASPGYRNCMVGTYADVVVADAIVKDIAGFEINLAVEALQKDAFAVPPSYASGAMGKDGLNEYTSLGFIPNDVSRTLDFGFADYATGQAFRRLCSMSSELSQAKLGAANSRMYSELSQEQCDHLLQQAKELLARANKAVASQYDSNKGLMVPKNQRGDSSYAFNDITWGNGYTEGNAWHHSFPPYAVDQLIELSKGNKGWGLSGSKDQDNLIQKLVQLFTHEGNFNVGSYGQVIHEMREMRTLAMGLYGHNNQPSHHIPFLFALLGKPQLTYYISRTIIDRAYGIDFYAGDEDNGEQGAWFVMAALGLVSITQGTVDYVISSPIFPFVRIYRGPKPANDKQGEYLKYDIARGELKAVTYGAFRNNAILTKSWPIQNTPGIDTTIHSMESSSSRDDLFDDEDDGQYLYLIAPGVSKTVMNVAGVVISSKQEANKNYQQVTMSTISDSILQTPNLVLRFIMEKELRDEDSLANKANVGQVAAASYPSIPLTAIKSVDPSSLGITSHQLSKQPETSSEHFEDIKSGYTEDAETNLTILKQELDLKSQYIIKLQEQVERLSQGNQKDASNKDSVSVSVLRGQSKGEVLVTDDKMLLSSNERELNREVTWDIYVMLLMALLMAGYLAALLLEILGLTGSNKNKAVGALLGFERPHAIKADARTV